MTPLTGYASQLLPSPGESGEVRGCDPDSAANEWEKTPLPVLLKCPWTTRGGGGG